MLGSVPRGLKDETVEYTLDAILPAYPKADQPYCIKEAAGWSPDPLYAEEEAAVFYHRSKWRVLIDSMSPRLFEGTKP